MASHKFAARDFQQYLSGLRSDARLHGIPAPLEPAYVQPPRAPGSPSFRHAAQDWLRTRENRLAEETLRSYKEYVSSLNRYFGALSLNQITIGHIREYQARRRQEAGAERVNHEIGRLKDIMGKKLWNPIADDYERLPEKDSEIGRALSEEEHERLFTAAEAEPRWRVAYLAGVLAANTTAGRRELLSLRVRDIDISRKMLFVNRGKNRYRQRDITLNDLALLAAAELLRRAKSLGSVEPDHYIFPFFDRHNGDYDPKKHSPSFRDPWRALTRSVGLKGLRFHDLRHTCITNLLEAGIPEAVVMELSGHVERRTLMRYSHQRVEAKRRAVSALQRVQRPTSA